MRSLALRALVTVAALGAATAAAAAPASQPAPLRVVILGDTRPPLLGERARAGPVPAVLAAVAREQPDLAFHTGDFVDRGASRSAWQRFAADTAPLRRARVPLYPVLGNHEYFDHLFLRSRRALDGYFRAFAFPAADAFGRPLPPVRPDALPPQGPRWYSVLKAGALFIVLDSNNLDDLGGVRVRQDVLSLKEWDEQLRFVREHLAAADRDPRVRHVFVLMHHPIYTRSTAHGSARPLWDFPLGTAAEREARTLKRWLDRSQKLRAVLVGHVHNYERYTCERDGLGPVVYFVVGGGGAPGRALAGPSRGDRFGPTPPQANACLRVTDGYRSRHKVPDGVPVWGYLRLAITPGEVRFEMVPVATPQPPDRGRITVTGRGVTITD
jgi:3',5'-cyclic AMP phosphodiesterase CpdA